MLCPSQRNFKFESDVIPENVDCVRALMGTEKDWKLSVAKTDLAISEYYGI